MKRLIFSVLLIAAVVAQHCPNYVSSRIQECVAPVADYARQLNGKEASSELGSAFSLPNMGGRVFNELCKLIAKFNVCVREYRQTCRNHVTISLIDSSYGYLCNEGYNTFMESAECLMELDRRAEVKACHDATLAEIEAANLVGGGVAVSAKMDRMCGALNYFSGCVRSPIKRECGASAWQVIYRVLKDTTNTLMPACQFTGASPRLTTPPSSDQLTTREPEPTTTYLRRTTTSEIAATRKSMRKNIVAPQQVADASAVRQFGLVLLLLVAWI